MRVFSTKRKTALAFLCAALAFMSVAALAADVQLDLSQSFNVDAIAGPKEFQECLTDGTSDIVDLFGTLESGQGQYVLDQYWFMIAETSGDPMAYSISGYSAGHPLNYSATQALPDDGVISGAAVDYHMASSVGNATLAGDWTEVADPSTYNIVSNVICVGAKHNSADWQISSVTAELPASQKGKYASVNFLLAAMKQAHKARNMQIVALYGPTGADEAILYSFSTLSGGSGPLMLDTTAPTGFAIAHTMSKVMNGTSGTTGAVIDSTANLFEFASAFTLDDTKDLWGFRFEDVDPSLNWAARGLTIFAATASEVPNTPPTAAAGVDQNVTDFDDNGAEDITLDGSGSTDTDGSIVSYVWEENSSQIATGASATVSMAVGVHTVDLTVTDDDGDSDTDSLIVTVNEAPNVAPTARAGSDQSVTDTDDSGAENVTLDGSASTDSDGSIVSYVWAENASQIATGVQPTVSLAVGVHTIDLTVTDDDGATDADSVDVTVEAAPPMGVDVQLDLSLSFNIDAIAGPKEFQDCLNNNQDLIDLFGGLSAGNGEYVLAQQWFMIAETTGDPMAYSIPGYAPGHPLNYTAAQALPDDGVITGAAVNYHMASSVGNATIAGDWTEVADPSTHNVLANTICVGAKHNSADWQITAVTAELPAGQKGKYASVNFLLAAMNKAHKARNMQIVALYGATGADEQILYSFSTLSGGSGPIMTDLTAPADFAIANTMSKVMNCTSGTAGAVIDDTANLFEFATAFALDETKDLWGFRFEDVNPTLNWAARGLAVFAATATTPGSTNEAPTANAGVDQSVNDSDDDGSESVTLDGSASTDGDGSIVSYVWEENASQIATGAQPTVSLAVGVHTIDLTVTDDGGATATDSVGITVNAYVNVAPSAHAGDDQTVTDSDNSGAEDVALDGSASTDGDGSIVSYVWEEDASQIATGAQPTVSLVVGVHAIDLTVTDDDGATATDSVDVTVNAGPTTTPPTADAGGNQTVLDREGDGAEDVVLDGRASSDSDGTIVSYLWEEGATQISTDALCRTNLSVGTHTIDLTVTDDGNATDTDTITVTVNALVGPKQRRNLKDTPTSARFTRPMDYVWPANDGDTDICLWADDKFAAASITIDDNIAPDHQWWIDRGTQYGWKFTWYIIIENLYEYSGNTYFGSWPEFNTLLGYGHDVQSHTITHDSNDDTRPEADVLYEYKDSIMLMEQYMPGNEVNTFGWPNGNFNRDLGALYAIAGRGVASGPNKPEITDYLYTKSASSDMSSDYVDCVLFGTSGISWLNNTNYLRGWMVCHFHSVNDKTAVAADMAYLDSQSDKMWIDLFRNVAKYGQERDTATLTVTTNTSSQVVFTLSDEMDDTLFDYPLTVKVKMYSAWSDVTATQDGQPIEATVVNHNGDNYALVKAVPDAGDVVVAPAAVNTPPTANAGDDQSVTDADDSGSENVTLDGSGSTDAEGAIASYVWEENSSQIATGVSPTYAFTVGTHTVVLTVTDSNGATDTDSVDITVNAPAPAGPTVLDLSGGFNMDAFCGPREYQECELAGQDLSELFGDQIDGSGNYILGQYKYMVANSTDAADAYSISGDAGHPVNLTGTEGVPVDGILTGAGNRPYHIASVGGNSTLAGDWTEAADPSTYANKSNCIYVGATHNIATFQISSVTVQLPAGQQGSYSDVNFVLAAADVADTARNMRIVALYGDGTDESILYSFSTADGGSGPLMVDTDGGADFTSVHAMSKWYDAPVGTTGSVDDQASNLWEFATALTLDDTKTLWGFRFEDANPSLNWNARGFTVFAATASGGAAPANQAPTANAGSDQNVVDSDDNGSEDVLLNGTLSDDADGSIVSYVWEENASQIATGASPIRTFDVGTHNVDLTVTDDDGATGSDSVVITVSAPVAANAYYVDQSHPSASDANPGTEALPWATVDKAVKTMTAGDTTYVKAGIYREYMKLTVSGTATDRITLAAYPGDRVVLSGASEITGWTQCDSTIAKGNPDYANIYYVDVSWKPESLHQDNVELCKGTAPEQGWFGVDAASGSDITCSALIEGDDYWNGAELFIWRTSATQWWVDEIVDFDAAGDTLTWAALGYLPTTADRFQLRGLVTLVNDPGEWAVEDIGGGQYRLFAWAYGGGDPDSYLMEAPDPSITTRWVLEFYDESYWTIDGFEIRHSASHGIGSYSNATPMAGHNIVQNCSIHHCENDGVYERYTDGSIYRRNYMGYNGGYDGGMGIDLVNPCTNVVIEENDIGFNTKDGIKVHGDYITIRRNYIHDQWYFGHADNLQTNAASTNLTIEDNLIWHADQSYMMDSITGLVIDGNVMGGCAANSVIFGESNLNLVGNTLACSGIGPLNLAGDNISMSDNILFPGHAYRAFAMESTKTFSSDYNLFWFGEGVGEMDNVVAIWDFDYASRGLAEYQTDSGQDANSLFGDPLFVNAPRYYCSVDTSRQMEFTTSRVYMLAADLSFFTVGDNVELDCDGVVRTITAIGADYIEFAPASEQVVFKSLTIGNWLTATDFTMDFTPGTGSPAIGNGSIGGNIGSAIDAHGFQNGDFTGDDVRDTPTWPEDPGDGKLRG